MVATQRRRDRGRTRAERSATTLGDELRSNRVAAGLSQTFVAAAAEISRSQVSRIERGRVRSVSIVRIATLAAVLGLELSVKLYPVENALRDRGHVALLERLRSAVHASFSWRSEVPLRQAGDMRAWDAKLSGAGVRIGVEAETRLLDAQALARRLALKRRDGDVDHVTLLVADTRGNRAVLRAFADALAADFPVPGARALAALSAGRDPGGSAVILI
jgi:transcriptional regulator with XRE-family HTH domain